MSARSRTPKSPEPEKLKGDVPLLSLRRDSPRPSSKPTSPSEGTYSTYPRCNTRSLLVDNDALGLLWALGAVFANRRTPSGIRTTVIWNRGTEPENFRYQFFKLATGNRFESSLAKKGSFNEFFSLLPSEIAALTNGHCAQDPKISQVGMRRNKEAVDSDTEVGDAWEEARITLLAAEAGIHPFVFGCAMLDLSSEFNSMPTGGELASSDLRAVYVTERGEALDSWLRTARTRSVVEEMKQALESAMDAAANLRLMMTDIKPQNIIVTNDNKVMFIDLGADFAHIYDEGVSKDCVYLINATLLANFFVCRDDTNNGLSVQIGAPLYERLRVLMRKYGEGGALKGELCQAVLRALASQAARLKERATLSKNTEPKRVAALVLAMAKHYGKWDEPGRYCETYDDSKPMIPQMLEFMFDAKNENQWQYRAEDETPKWSKT